MTAGLRLELVTQENVRAACDLKLRPGQEGGGYGRFAVGEVCREALRRGQHRLTVSCTPGENGPAGFCRRLGFRPTGEFNQGEEVAELLLTEPPAVS